MFALAILDKTSVLTVELELVLAITNAPVIPLG
jgi:hypothetical protein